MSKPTYHVRHEAVDRLCRDGCDVCVVLGWNHTTGLVDALTFRGMRSTVPSPRFAKLWTPLLDGPRCYRTIHLDEEIATITFEASNVWNAGRPHVGCVPEVWWVAGDRRVIERKLSLYGLSLHREIETDMILGLTHHRWTAEGEFHEPPSVFKGHSRDEIVAYEQESK